MISTILLVITIIAFGIYVFKNPPNQRTTSISELSAPESSTNDKICMDYSDDPMNTLDIDLIRDMVDGYKNNQLKHINDAENIDDAYSIWFDLDILKKFIYHIEYKALNNNNAINPENLGLRFYYSRYPDELPSQYTDLNTVSITYAKHHTLIAIPTYRKNENSPNIDFNPLDTDTFWEGIPSNYSGPISSLPLTKSSQNQSIGAQNHGSLYPPHSNNGIAF
ncbi:hypothetical protein [uncultured Olleya sp.]|uniref:hypothetical protein n=1 Tax=uncultured Olleya sp. TaxID=757243 RepID=UPI002591EB9F|nr:hypothetical protein [uncultured Olleya sp.]